MSDGNDGSKKILSLGDLAPGDVLLYYRDSVLGWAIRKFDGTLASHAALYLGEGKVAEAIGRGLVMQPLPQSLGLHSNDYILVRRWNGEPASTPVAPVLKTASRLLDSHAGYAHSELLLLAILGMTRKLTLTPKLRVLLRRVLDRSAALLLESVRSSGKRSFICSEFVYRCFAEAAERTGQDAYSIQIAGLAWVKGGAFDAGPARPLADDSLLDRARIAWDEAAAERSGLPGFDDGSGHNWLEPPVVSDAEIEESAREFQNEPNDGPLERGLGDPSGADELLPAMQRFVRALDEYQCWDRGERAGFGAGDQSVPSWQVALAIVGNFITPGDLFKSATLVAQGRLALEPNGRTHMPETVSENTPLKARDAPRDHVLLIGIDGYSTRPLRGCVNDLLAMRDLLEQRFGVSTAAITVLASPAPGRQVEGSRPASMEEIRGALDRLDSDAVAAGDRIIIYYSGHGGSRAVVGDSMRHLVECLVPADYAADVAGPLLYDAEMNRRLASLARRTSNITVLLDCCHSAGTTRGSFLAEEDAVRMLPLPSLAVPVTIHQMLPDGVDLSGETRTLNQPRAQMVIAAACMADESALETSDQAGTRHGVFTRSLLSTLRTVPPEATWKEIWTPILQETRPRQNPVLIGNENRTVFGEAHAGDRGELPVEPDENGYRVEAGTLVDITPGTRITVYGADPATLPEVGAAEKHVEAGTLVVFDAQPTSARARADRPFPWPAKARCRVETFGTPTLTVCFEPSPSKEVLARIAVDKSIRVTAAEKAEVFLRAVDGSWVLCDDLHALARQGHPELLRCQDEDVLAMLRHYIRYRTPLRLAARSTDLLGALDLRLLDARHALTNPQAPKLPDVESLNGFRYGLRVGQPFCMVAENRSSSTLRSVALLNCGSSGRVQHLAAFVLPAHGSHALWLGEELGAPFRLEGPAGIERLVLIGSTKPGLDWRFLETESGFRSTSKDFGTTRDVSQAQPRCLYTATTVAVRVLDGP